MAFILAGALPESEFSVINDISVIADMDKDDVYFPSVLKLYRSGITVGSDEYGNYFPDRSLTRAECAAILNRMIDPTKRKTFTPLIGQVTISHTEITLNVGESFQLLATPVSGIDNGSRVGWKTDKSDVVEVSEDGIVTALKEGKALVWPVDVNGEKKWPGV